ncbi:MAG: universal stress protein [Bacteroidales bacterium]|nr:universal stress protein [Bacteroidales bacterium]MCF8344392.1 universal stress protein [Bacteroidales bacterium]MCF8351964.1 universal stress protein [Bacteroidales bacterium]MCF8376378.1 universal stress protein [Bacteroidales bacterium]MCF8401238.1 universal stress protein [Bacteroidales bacterium]
MEKIIVATDFSDCSINALEHALTLADKADADLRLVWVNKPESLKDTFETVPENVEEAVTKKFQELKDKYQPGLEKGKVDFEIRKGKIYREIVHAAQEFNADLIVIGTHGSSGFEEFWLGSNAFKVVNASKTPIITIRGGVDIDRDLNKIVMPIDSTLETRQKVPVTAELAALFDAEIHILAFYTTNVEAIQLRVDQYSKQAIEFLEDEGVKYKLIRIDDDRITNKTIEYAKSVDANLISIMTEQERRTLNLWMGTFAARMVNHSPIPVLSINPDISDIQLSR